MPKQKQVTYGILSSKLFIWTTMEGQLCICSFIIPHI